MKRKEAIALGLKKYVPDNSCFRGHRERYTNGWGCVVCENERKISIEYKAWLAIKQRCYNKNTVAYKDYGGRGIFMCDRWSNSFENFLADMGEKPEGLCLERIDNNKGYSPENCKWATYTEQARNRRSNRLITVAGKTMLLIEWAEFLNMQPALLRKKLKRQNIEETIEERRNIKKIKDKSKIVSIGWIAKTLNCTKSNVCAMRGKNQMSLNEYTYNNKAALNIEDIVCYLKSKNKYKAALILNNETMVGVGSKYGVTRETVRQIIVNKIKGRDGSKSQQIKRYLDSLVDMYKICESKIVLENKLIELSKKSVATV